MVVDGTATMEMFDEVTPDLILLDISVPGVLGLELTRQVKDDHRLAKIPLIATTANVLTGDRKRCLQADCDDYLPKPLDISRLRKLLHTYSD